MNFTSIKERIAISDAFSAEERGFILDAINATSQALEETGRLLVLSPPNTLGRIDAIYTALSLDDGGEALMAIPLAGSSHFTVPVALANPRTFQAVQPRLQLAARLHGKIVRLAKFTKREDIGMIMP